MWRLKVTDGFRTANLAPGESVLLEGDTKISGFQVRKNLSSWFLEQSFFVVL